MPQQPTKETRKLAVEFDHITFGYTDKVVNLDDVSFGIYENEYVCIIGHNGSGKSTLSKVLTGLLQPRNGTIRLFNKAINKSNLKHLRDNIGIVFQNPDNQFIGLTAEDDIAFGLENRKVDPHAMHDIIVAAAQIVNVDGLLELEATKLSGGQKQRVAIASVLAINPKVIIFDESTAMLDPKSKQELKNLMVVLKEQFNKTVISITHDMEEVINADRVIILKGGKLIETGTPVEVFENRDFLKNISLDIPFTLQLSSLLNQTHKDIAATLDVEKLLESICQTSK
ncbi:MAG: energy-coupling factor transporter ATPase [Mycoplasmataceae bacterium]|jgi:energy-coupling factor transport system ATP-binding protein|nr:energy-coupling factor transporter ATPase [Mycoplasmataceae bacterium]